MQSLEEKLADFFQEQIQIYGDEFALSDKKLCLDEEVADCSHEIRQQDASSLDELYGITHTCTKCKLGTKRTHFVFGNGNPNADIMLIGEAPGADEDRIGRVFVGKAGELLDKILAAIDLERDQVFIGNILKCRPPLNRNPLPEEIEACLPYLFKQIDLIQPEFILCLGRIAAQTLLDTDESLSKLRQQEHRVRNARCFVTYHPAALLRNTSFKRPTWEDVKLLKQRYDEWKAQQ